MKIVMNRRIINEVLTTYLPTVLILFIVYATTFFKPFYFEAVVTVNLTSLLVLTTLFISVSKSLPPTAYVKMIDIWLIFAQLIPFAEVKRIIHFLVIYLVYSIDIGMNVDRFCFTHLWNVYKETGSGRSIIMVVQGQLMKEATNCSRNQIN